MEQHYLVFETAQGFCGIAWSGTGITRFRLPYPDRASAQAQFDGKAKPHEPPPPVAAVVEQAVRYFAGEQIDFSPIELDLSTVDPGRRPIYDALLEYIRQHMHSCSRAGSVPSHQNLWRYFR